MDVTIPAGDVSLPGMLEIPGGAPSVVIFAHGSGSGRRSPRNRWVAHALGDAGFGTLLLDLLTHAEASDRANVFDIPLLASRLAMAAQWLRTSGAAGPGGWEGRVAYFGASTGAGAALMAAAADPSIAAVVSRGGRPDLAGAALPHVTAPTLLIVGGHDQQVLGLNQAASDAMVCEQELIVVPGAGHLFEEPGTLEEVTRLTIDWFERYAGT